jgi:hypothetical protein
MLGELSEDLAADHRTCLVRVYGENQRVLRMNHARDAQKCAHCEREQYRLQHSDLRQEDREHILSFRGSSVHLQRASWPCTSAKKSA